MTGCSPTRSRRRAGLALATALSVACSAGTAQANTVGNLYGYGAGKWSVFSPFTAGWSGTAMLAQAPEVASIATGNKWEMHWGCPVAGSEIAQVSFGGLRTQAASSLEVRVLGNGVVRWAIADVSLPQSPAPGQGYAVNLPGGICSAHLALHQTENRRQHKRGYFLDSPRILVRDLTAPSVILHQISQGWLRGTTVMSVGWSTADNFGADGVTGQQILVAGKTLWSGPAAVGSFQAQVDLSSIGDGVHAVQVRANGDGTGAGTAGGTVHIDRTLPTLSTQAPSHPGTARTVTLSWNSSDATSGVASTRAEIAHGAGWVNLAEAGGGAVTRTLTVPSSVADGAHSWRVVATDKAGNVRTGAGAGAIVVDTTPPQLEVMAAPQGWVGEAQIDARVDDNLAVVLGLGDTEVDVNTAVDGGEGGQWLRVLTTRPSPGRALLPIDLSAVRDGTHLVRLTARNGGPFGAHLWTRRSITLRIDRTPPAVSAAGFAPAKGRLLRASWTAEDALSGVARVQVQRAEEGVWRTLGDAPAGDGAGALVVDAATLGVGTHRMRVRLIDRAGNAAVREGTLTIEAESAAASGGATGDQAPGHSGLASTAPDPLARLYGARISLSAPGARRTRAANGRTVLLRPLTSGERMPIAGRLVDRGGRPIGGAQIEARGHRGVVLGRARTGRDGRFRMGARPAIGGPVRVGVPVGRALLPARAEQDLRLQVRPRVVLRRQRHAVRTGETVVFAGRVYPAPARIGRGAHKSVILEWRDPLRGVWRPVVNTRLRADGTFSIPWRFSLQNIAVPIRARVPAELGWPLLPAISQPIVVTPR